MPGKTYIYLIFISLIVIILPSCEDKLPVISTLSVTDITQYTARSGGNIEDEGDAQVVSRGIIWGKDIPTLSSFEGMNSEGTGPGIFESTLTGLDRNTVYMTRAFASNKYGTSYGNVMLFRTLDKTPSKATPITEWPAEISSSSAKLTGNITSDGGSEVTERGFYLGISSNPEIEGTKLKAGSGTGPFSFTVTSLKVNTTYYFRAYAVNSAGESLGTVIYFSTNMTASVPKVFNSSLAYGSVTDIDGNEYRTIPIGTQIWMAEDLKVTHFNDGIVIPNVTGNLAWGALTTPAYCWYNNDIIYKQNFGALYNWFTVETGKLCPAGWHVPSDEEWTILTDYLGGTDFAGGKLKEAGLAHWNSPNTGATNSSGFTSLPTGGRRYPEGFFYGVGVYDAWWSSTEYNYLKPYYRSIASMNEIVFRGYGTLKGAGISIRCIKD
jgi:uncharacterized protein (TIGR02145 family)